MGGGTGGGGGTIQTGTFTISGHVTYDFVRAVYSVANDRGTLDFANSQQRPVRNGLVRVLEGTTVRAMTNTAQDGAYSLTFTAMGTGPLTVQAVARTTSPPILIQDNTAQNAIWAMGANVPMGGGTVDLRATHGWLGTRYDPNLRKAAPFAVLDTAYTAASTFLAARPSLNFPLLKINWSPNNTTDDNGTIAQGFIGTSYYDAEINEIFVVGKDGVDTDEYDNHVIAHEWGHYFEANVSRSDSLGGNHSSGDVLDPREAFTEGWGDACSAISLNDPIYSDTYFSTGSIDAFGWNTEDEPMPTDDPARGSFSEATVMRFMYDLWDSTNEGGFDTTTLDLGTITDAFTAGHRTTNALCTTGSFITSLKAQAGVNSAAVDTLLSHWNIGSITSEFGAGDAPLRAMYTDVAALPLNQTATLNGREEYNFKSQNQYWVVTGNGARITVSSTTAEDVEITAYRQGVQVGYADDVYDGTETFSFNSTAGTVYVIVLTGYGAVSGNYTATMNITSP